MTTLQGAGFKVPSEVADIVEACPGYRIIESVEELVALSCRDAVNGWHEVSYEVPGKGKVVEATVCRVRNGVAANYPDPYMRRRDPDCTLIGDALPTNKRRFSERFGVDFNTVRRETFEWLKTQDLVLFPFAAGGIERGIDALVLMPSNAGFFALGLALLQRMLEHGTVPEGFTPKAVIYVAPPFRHTHFDGKQVVVHNRREDLHELFSYNLYPGHNSPGNNHARVRAWLTGRIHSVFPNKAGTAGHGVNIQKQ